MTQRLAQILAALAVVLLTVEPASARPQRVSYYVPPAYSYRGLEMMWAPIRPYSYYGLEYTLWRVGPNPSNGSFILSAAPTPTFDELSGLGVASGPQPERGEVSVVPEPSTFVLTALAVAGLALLHRKRR